LQKNKLLKRGIRYCIYILVLFLILNISLHLYLISFRLIVFDEKFYKSEFKKYNVYERLAGQDIDKINSDILGYFRHEERAVPIGNDFFNEKEKAHLIDVKLLVRLVLFLLYSGFLAIALKFILLWVLVNYQKEDIWNYSYFMLTASGILTIIPALFIWAVMKLNFDSFFTFFHKIAFDNNLWLMNPATDKIILMYPQGLFYDIAIKIAIFTLIQAIALIVIGISCYKIRQRFKNKETISRI